MADLMNKTMNLIQVHNDEADDDKAEANFMGLFVVVAVDKSNDAEHSPNP